MFRTRIERLRHNQTFGAAVCEHEAVVILGEQRVHRDGNDAGFQAAKKRGRPVDRVQQRDQHALLARYAERAQHSTKSRYAVGELAIGKGGTRVDVSGLIGAAGGKIALQDIGSEIVVTWDRAHGRGRD